MEGWHLFSWNHFFEGMNSVLNPKTPLSLICRLLTRHRTPRRWQDDACFPFFLVASLLLWILNHFRVDHKLLLLRLLSSLLVVLNWLTLYLTDNLLQLLSDDACKLFHSDIHPFFHLLYLCFLMPPGLDTTVARRIMNVNMSPLVVQPFRMW